MRARERWCLLAPATAPHRPLVGEPHAVMADAEAGSLVIGDAGRCAVVGVWSDVRMIAARRRNGAGHADGRRTSTFVARGGLILVHLAHCPQSHNILWLSSKNGHRNINI